MTERETIDALENRLNKIGNTVQALQVIMWDVCQMNPEDAIGRQRRDALVGMGDVLEALTVES